MLYAIRTKYLLSKIIQFYRRSSFIPAPSRIDLKNRDCVARIVADMKLLGENKQLINLLQGWI